MKDLLLYIAKNLVEHPDEVTVTEKQGTDELTLELHVAPDDMGKVIGRQGRIAKEIRTVIRSYAQRTGEKYRSILLTEKMHPKPVALGAFFAAHEKMQRAALKIAER